MCHMWIAAKVDDATSSVNATELAPADDWWLCGQSCDVIPLHHADVELATAEVGALVVWRRVMVIGMPLAVWIVAPVAMPTSDGSTARRNL